MEGRAIQIGALNRIVESLEQELSYYRKNYKPVEVLRELIDSERKTNEILTAEIEQLKGRLNQGDWTTLFQKQSI
jgi:hypothetical protein